MSDRVANRLSSAPSDGIVVSRTQPAGRPSMSRLTVLVLAGARPASAIEPLPSR